MAKNERLRTCPYTDSGVCLVEKRLNQMEKDFENSGDFEALQWDKEIERAVVGPVCEGCEVLEEIKARRAS